MHLKQESLRKASISLKIINKLSSFICKQFRTAHNPLCQKKLKLYRARRLEKPQIIHRKFPKNPHLTSIIDLIVAPQFPFFLYFFSLPAVVVLCFQRYDCPIQVKCYPLLSLFQYCDHKQIFFVISSTPC